MASLSSLIQPGAAAGGAQPSNMLASLLANGGQISPPVNPAPTPAPTRDQAIAGYHRMQETKRFMGRILDNPKTGHENIRPLVLAAGADLIGARIMSITEFMRGIEKFPPSDNPLAQKQWVRHLYDVSSMAQRKLLMDHRAANPPDYQHGTPWSADNHSDNMTGLMAHYPS